MLEIIRGKVTEAMSKINPEELPFNLENEIGSVEEAETPMSGVYYLCARKEADDHAIRKYYVVSEASPIYQRVSAYGQPIGNLRLYAMQEDTSGWRIVDYELCKYMAKAQSAPRTEKVLHELALFAAVYHPEYFGEYPVPLHTPRGYTLRHRKIANGIYWLETSWCEEMLALCYPVWNTELSGMARVIGEATEYDRAHDLGETMGYLFFTAQSSCVPIFELMETRKEWEGTLVNKPALMNAIWQYLPKYALMKNNQEQIGKKDLVSRVMAELGVELEKEPPSPERMICIYPDAGTDFLLWK